MFFSFGWLCGIAVIRIQLCTYTCGNIINNTDERKHFFRKIIPLTLYWKWLRKGCERVMCERWVRDWTNCNILTPSSFVFSSTSFSFYSGVLRAHSPLLGAGSLNSILSPTYWLQTNWTSCRIGLYHSLTPTCFLWASNLHPIQPVHSQGYLRPDAPVPWSTAGSEVNMLQLLLVSHSEWQLSTWFRSHVGGECSLWPFQESLAPLINSPDRNPWTHQQHRILPFYLRPHTQGNIKILIRLRPQELSYIRENGMRVKICLFQLLYYRSEEKWGRRRCSLCIVLCFYLFFFFILLYTLCSFPF